MQSAGVQMNSKFFLYAFVQILLQTLSTYPLTHILSDFIFLWKQNKLD